MKYLIVSGDSFSDKNFRSSDHPDLDTSWPKWPELLAEKLGMKCINLAIGGKGNEFIYSTLQDQILSMPNKDEIGLVIAAWSQCHRRDFQLGGYSLIDDDQIHTISGSNWQDNKIDSCGDLMYWVKRSLRYYSAFEILCERYNIPYAHTQMIHLYKDYLAGDFRNQEGHYPGDSKRDEELILNILLDHDKMLDTSKFIDWPCVKPLGGLPINQEVFGELQQGNPWVISDLDDHPNAAGQVKIAEYIYDWMG